jgi:hypothetical protein
MQPQVLFLETGMHLRLNFTPVSALMMRRETSAMNKLESTAYYQCQRPVDDYIDQFEKLITEARYTEGQVIIMKFRRGLDGTLQDHIVEIGVDRLFSDDPVGWYEAACHFEANWVDNCAFNAVRRHTHSATTGSAHHTAPLPHPAA